MTPADLSRLIAAVCVAVWLSSACGAFFGRASYDFLFLFLRRSPAWRRFDRAMSRLFGRLNGGA